MAQIICPKCGYERQPNDLSPDYECPKCKVIYEKAINKAHLDIQNRQNNNKQRDDVQTKPIEIKRSIHSSPQNLLIKNKKIVFYFSLSVTLLFLVIIFGFYTEKKDSNTNNTSINEKPQNVDNKWDISESKLKFLIQNAIYSNFRKQYTSQISDVTLKKFEILKKTTKANYCAYRASVNYEITVRSEYDITMRSTVEKKQEIDFNLTKNDFNEFEVELMNASYAETVDKPDNKNNVTKKVNIDFYASEGYKNVKWGDTLTDVEQKFGDLIKSERDESDNDMHLNIERYSQKNINNANIKYRSFTFMEGQLVEVHNGLDTGNSNLILEKMIETFGDDYEEETIYARSIGLDSQKYKWDKNETIIEYSSITNITKDNIEFFETTDYQSRKFVAFLEEYKKEYEKENDIKTKENLDF